MKGDFSKLSFDKNKRYSGVRMQQGRVQLDSDWNEQMDIINYRLHTETMDFIGGSGAPSESPGFKLEFDTDKNDFKITKGRYYVGGLLCENEDDQFYTNQLDYPDQQLPSEEGNYVAYLEVWQQNLTALDDSNMREIALGGPDTTTRLINRAQVKLLKLQSKSENLADLIKLKQGSDWQELTAPTSNTLIPNIDSAYNLGNQLYRIEIHNDKKDNETFKWSRDNASISFAIAITSDSSSFDFKYINIIRTAADEQVDFGSHKGGNAWGELTNIENEILDKPGIFVQVAVESSSDNLSVLNYKFPNYDNIIEPDKLIENQKDQLKKCTILRLWDSKEVQILKDEIEIENGLKIKFTIGKDRKYRIGDYWLIPSRITNTGKDSILWPIHPDGKPYLPCRCHGIKRYYVPLALLNKKDTWTNLKDYRTIFSCISNFKVMDAIVVDSNFKAKKQTELPISIDAEGNVTITGKLTVIGDFIHTEERDS